MEEPVIGRPIFENLKAEADQITKPQSWWLPALFFALFGAFLWFSTRHGHAVGDDFAMYIIHARNLVEGRAYNATGYLYNPHYPEVGPKTYPPVFPLLLAPIYRIYGLDIEALKIVGLVSAWLAVWLFYFYWRKELPTPVLFLLLATFAFNPMVCLFKDSILSDLPFLCWLVLAFLLVQRFYEQERLIVNQHVSALLLAGVIYLAYGTRSIGLILLISLVLYDLWHRRWLRALTLEVSVITAALVVLQNFFVHSDSSYGDQFTVTMQNVIFNVTIYLMEYSLFWGSGYSNYGLNALFVIICGLAVWGWWISVRKRVTYLAIFSLIYMPPILLVSLRVQERYLVPLMAPTFYYAWLGLCQLSERFSGKRQWALAGFTALTLMVFASYGLAYRQADWRPYNEGVSLPATRELVSFIQQSTKPEDILVTITPRALALLTNRKCSVWHKAADEQELWRYWNAIGARFLIVGPADVFPDYQQYLQQVIARNAQKFEAFYQNGAYQMYRIKVGD